LKKKKRTQFTFQIQQDAPEGGQIKGKNIKVPAGIGKDAYPDIKEPVRVEHTRTTGYGGGETRKMDIPPQNTQKGFPPPRRGLPPRNVQQDDEDPNPPPRRGPSRLPPRNQPQDEENNDQEEDNPPPPRRMVGGRGVGLPLPRRTPPPM